MRKEPRKRAALGRRRLAVMVVCFCWACFSTAAQVTDGFYYVLNGPVDQSAALTLVHGDPTASGYTQWEIWLFKKNSARSSIDNRWGVLEGKSPQSVLAQLKNAQASEKAYETFVGPGTWGQFTTFNAAGPIAIIGGRENRKPEILSRLEELSKSYDKVTKIADIYAKIVSADPLRKFEFPMREYLDQMKETLEQINQLSAKVTHYTEPALAQLDKDFDELNESVRVAQTNSAHARTLTGDWSVIFDPDAHVMTKPNVFVRADGTMSFKPDAAHGSWNDLTYDAGGGSRARQTITATGDVVTFRTDKTASQYLPASTDVVTFPDILRLNLSPIMKVEDGLWDLTIQGDFDEQYDGGPVIHRNAEYTHLTFGTQEQAQQTYAFLKSAISNHGTAH
jgi:hypothetical protein